MSLTTAKAGRIHWLDNLRTIIIFLVVLYHIGGVYEGAGLWASFWIIDDPDTMTWVGIMGIVFDLLVMPVMFFISGYLTPKSYEKKTDWEFIKSKLLRLMLPWLLAVFTLIPLYKVIFRYSRGLPQQNWTTYFHFNNPNSQNWLWFLPVLFLFNLIYLLLAKLKVDFSKISLTWAVIAASLIAIVGSFLVGNIWGFRSWTLTPLIDFENERIIAYLLTFFLGVICFRRNTFANLPKKKILYIIASSTTWLPVTAHIFLRLMPFFDPYFQVTDMYRVLWWVSFHLSTLTLAYTFIESFRFYLNRTGPIWKALNQYSYTVYIIHVIMIGVFGVLLMRTGWPVLVKYLLLIVLTYLSSNLIGAVIQWIGKRMKPARTPSK